MGWSAGFLTSLEAPTVRPRFAVETFDTVNGAGVGVPGVRFTTHPEAGALPWMTYDLVVGGHEVNLSTWQYQRQAWSFTLAVHTESQARTVAQTLRRGTLVRLKVDARGLPGIAGWETIQSGVVVNVTWSARTGLHRVEVWDLMTAMRRRLTTSTTDNRLFRNVGSGTTIANTAYSPTDGTIEVASTALFELPGVGAGLVRVEPSGGGAPFYVEYTGKTATHLTGVASTASRGTTLASAAVGSAVVHVAHVEGRPDQILGRILTSSVGGGNGVLDVYPDGWGFGLGWDSVMDYGDLVGAVGAQLLGTVAGGYVVSAVVEEEPSDAFGWVDDFLSSLALWPVNRQGRITLRGAQQPYSTALPVEIIENRDVVDASVSFYSAQQPIQRNNSRATGNTTSATEQSAVGGVSTFPADARRDYDVTHLYFDNEAATLTDLVGRVGPWDTVVCEAVDLTLRSAAWARLCPGDIVALNLPPVAGRFWTRGRLSRSVTGHKRLRGMVTKVRPDFIGGKTEIRVAVPPGNAAADLQ